MAETCATARTSPGLSDVSAAASVCSSIYSVGTCSPSTRMTLYGVKFVPWTVRAAVAAAHAGERDLVDAEVQLHRLHRHLPARCIVLAVEHVILQHAQAVLEGLAAGLIVAVALMIAQDRAVVDAEAVEHHGGQLIGLHIAVGLFGVEIRPDNIFRGLHGAAAQLVLRDAEARQMIAVEYDDRRLAERGEPTHKARDKGIRLLELVEVILQPGAAGFGLLPRDPDGSRALQRLRGILAVGLHGDGEDEIAALGGAQRLQDLLRQDGTFAQPSGFRSTSCMYSSDVNVSKPKLA